MITKEPFYPLTLFPPEAIDQQLKKIVSHQIFLDAPILSKFLGYIVEQTLQGHANQIKEYSIGVHVLGKPHDFRPQDSGIVRIHAGRLRRALTKYYVQSGTNDEICISIPKGGYVPVFHPKLSFHDVDSVTEKQKKATIGIASMMFSKKNPVCASFAGALELQLGTALMKSNSFSLIAYSAMNKLFDDRITIEQLTSAAGVQYLLTGDLQSKGNSIRIYLQLIGLKTGYLVWSQMYERNFSAEKLFEVQDEIVNKAAMELAGLQPQS